MSALWNSVLFRFDDVIPRLQLCHRISEQIVGVGGYKRKNLIFMTLSPGIWFGAAASPRITEIRHYSGEHRSRRRLCGQKTFHIFHDEDKRLKAGNDPQIFEIQKVPVIGVSVV